MRETEFIEKIVDDIYRRLHVPLRGVLPLLIGMDYSIKFVTSWLKDGSSDTGDILTISGIGGIGKTSLAKYIYGLHFREFDTCSCIEDIGRRCVNKFNGLLNLQEQLCYDISIRTSAQVHDISVYTSKIENAISRKKMFLVLDDIDSLDQLDALLGNKGVYPGSKVIITTHETSLIESCALFRTKNKPKHAKHELRGLCETDSRQLLCNHAFMSSNPKDGYGEVIEKLVKYCEGHPLALKVLGKSLHDKDLAYCEGQIKLLKKENGTPISSVLRTSFDSLPSEEDKESFKHIACFFVGMDIDVTETILHACNINTSVVFRNLIDRCLIGIGWNNELVMHQLLQEMGKFIVRKESLHKPWKRSRLCCHDESLEVLKRKTGTKNIRGLTLDTRMLKNEKLRDTSELETNALSKMDNMILLQLNFVKINGSYEKFPKELRWLCMNGFPLKCIPSDLPMENMVVLDMSYSNIESFGVSYSNPQKPLMRQKLTRSCSKGKKLIGSLKILNLSYCEHLRSLGGFDGLPALERLIVRNCIGLVQVCESIEQCAKLLIIDMSYCKNLEKGPTIDKLNVKTLLLDGCNLGESRISIRNIDSPKMFKVNNLVMDSKISSSAIPSDTKFFRISLPRSLVILSLANNNLSNESFPMDFSCLSMLKELCLDHNPIISLPNCVISLPMIEKLAMRDCHMLRFVEHPPRTLTHLDLRIVEDYHERSLVHVAFDPEMSPLRLSLAWNSLAPPSFQIEGVVKIQPMTDVEEKVLCSLGWINFDFLNQMHVKIGYIYPDLKEFVIQMYYEFGIFSTFYGGEFMPNWIRHRSKGPSISFTIPPMPNWTKPTTSYQLRGINFCFVHSPSYQFRDIYFDIVDFSTIIVSNITKDCTWIYHHYIDKVSAGGECVIFLTHWMFGKNEMQVGDQVTITVIELFNQVTKECGVGFVYDDGKIDEDVLGYYKSWNHIIGGDLTAFHLKTGEYSLDFSRFWYYNDEHDSYNYDDIHTNYKERMWFRALSQRKSNIVGETLKEEENDAVREGKKNGASLLLEEERCSTLVLNENGESCLLNLNTAVGDNNNCIALKSGNVEKFVFARSVKIDPPTVISGLSDRRDGCFSTKDSKLAKKDLEVHTTISEGWREVVTYEWDKDIWVASRNIMAMSDDQDHGETMYDDRGQPSNFGTRKDLFFNANRNIMSTQEHEDTKMNFSKEDAGIKISKILNPRFIKPQIDKESGAAVIPIDVVQRGSELFPHMLYGYLVGEGVTYSIVNHHIRNMWTAHGIEDVVMNDQGVYFFKFNNEKGLIDVMENRPWTIENVPLYLQRWEAGLDLSKPMEEKVPLWIKIFDIPIELWTEEGLNTIASNLGNPLAFDSLTETKCESGKGLAGYASVLIEMVATEEWPDEIEILVPKLNGSGSMRSRLRVEYSLFTPEDIQPNIIDSASQSQKVDENGFQ
ncbi:hypothetical protein Lser_V15G03005 [Lactuca serriola]